MAITWKTRVVTPEVPFGIDDDKGDSGSGGATHLDIIRRKAFEEAITELNILKACVSVPYDQRTIDDAISRIQQRIRLTCPNGVTDHYIPDFEEQMGA